jgi:Mg-chelatase subunit ChlI
VPLSDEEMRLLEQMERALVEEDPKFASTLRGNRFARATRARIIVAAVAFVAGIAVLMTGAVMRITIVGIIGFVLMLASATVGLSAWRGRQATTEQDGTRGQFEAPDSPAGLSLIHGGRPTRKPRRTSGGGRKPKQSLMQRLEERWQRRRDQNGF